MRTLKITISCLLFTSLLSTSAISSPADGHSLSQNVIKHVKLGVLSGAMGGAIIGASFASWDCIKNVFIGEIPARKYIFLQDIATRIWFKILGPSPNSPNVSMTRALCSEGIGSNVFRYLSGGTSAPHLFEPQFSPFATGDSFTGTYEFKPSKIVPCLTFIAATSLDVGFLGAISGATIGALYGTGKYFWDKYRLKDQIRRLKR